MAVARGRRARTPPFPAFVRRVWKTIRERSLFERGEGVLVAASGGADSMALLDALAQLREVLGLSLIAAYVDHGLRTGTLEEARLVERFAKARRVPFERLAVRVEPRGSIEEKAREARHAALIACAGRHGLSKIALGHTASDQAETVLMWLLRGTGVRGLAGMRARRAAFVRPLIDVTRDETRAFVRGRGISFVDDPMNHEKRFVRNRIREGLVPMLARDFNPRVVSSLCALADEVARLNDWLDETARGAGSSVGFPGVTLLRSLPRPMRDRVLEEALCERRPGMRLQRRHREAIERLVMSQNGRSSVGLPGCALERCSDRLVVRETAPALGIGKIARKMVG